MVIVGNGHELEFGELVDFFLPLVVDGVRDNDEGEGVRGELAEAEHGDGFAGADFTGEDCYVAADLASLELVLELEVGGVVDVEVEACVEEGHVLARLDEDDDGVALPLEHPGELLSLVAVEGVALRVEVEFWLVDGAGDVEVADPDVDVVFEDEVGVPPDAVAEELLLENGGPEWVELELVVLLVVDLVERLETEQEAPLVLDDHEAADLEHLVGR